MSFNQDWDRAERLYALALQARDNNLTDCAVELEELAAEASARADGASSELQQPSGLQRPAIRRCPGLPRPGVLSFGK
jgi:hypothetical protein